MMLIIEKVIIVDEYLNYSNFFSKKSAKVLPESKEIYKHAIKLKKSK